MTKPTVLLDCDGVLADFIGEALHAVYTVTGLSFTPEDVTEFDFCKALGLDRDQAAAVKREIAQPGFAKHLHVYPGAREGVAALEAIADVYIVTSPFNSNPTWTHDREAWLSRHFGIHHSRVIHTSAKHLVRGDFFIDDKADAVVAWQEANPHGRAAIWQTPHNLNEQVFGRIAGWDALEHYVRFMTACDTPSSPNADGTFHDPSDELTPIERGLSELANATETRTEEGE